MKNLWFLICICLVITGQVVLAEPEDMELCSSPGQPAPMGAGMDPPPSYEMPTGFVYLGSVPRLPYCVGGGCTATAMAMLLGYYDNIGYPRVWQPPTGVADHPFPTGGIPFDNQEFLVDANGEPLTNFTATTYPNLCAFAATKAGVYYRDSSSRGNIDDYSNIPSEIWSDITQYPAWMESHPTSLSSDPWVDNSWIAHDYLSDEEIAEGVLSNGDCLADYLGSSVYYYRYNRDGTARAYMNTTSGTPYVFLPSRHPFHNTPTLSSLMDYTWGLSRWVADKSGYWTTDTKTTTLPPYTTYRDVSSCYSQSISGLVAQPEPGDPHGVVFQDIVAEIDAGRPVIMLAYRLALVQALNANPPEYVLNETSEGHALLVFAYNQATSEVGVYDGWYENAYTGPSMRAIHFPTPAEVFRHSRNKNLPNYGNDTVGFVRESNGTYWKPVGFTFLKIDDNPRCQPPLLSTDWPSGVYAEPFEVSISNPAIAGCTHVRYQLDNRDPNCASPAIALDANGDGTSTLTIDRDTMLKARTFKDHAEGAVTGNIASSIQDRVFAVWSANKNIKKWMNGSPVSMANSIVTAVIDSDNFYAEERDKRLFAAKVNKAGHGLAVGDEIQITVGTIQTDVTTDERYIVAALINKLATPTKVIEPFAMTCSAVGGANYLPPLLPEEEGEGNGQLGVTGAYGLNNVGLLIKICGKVTHIYNEAWEKWFTVDDGSGRIDSSTYAGVRVWCPISIPEGLAVDDLVVVTGISSLYKDQNDRHSLLLPRSESDIIVY